MPTFKPTSQIKSAGRTIQTTLKCPKCQKTGTFTIQGSASFDVDSQQSIFDHDDYSWEDNSKIECHQCAYNGTVKDFQINEVDEEASP
jgi:hypothetical protein